MKKNTILCSNCDRVAEHQHHVVPKVYGGTFTVPVCQLCHDLTHGISRTSTNYLTRFGKAKNNRENYIKVFCGLLYENKSLLTIERECGIDITKLKRIVNNLYLFNWEHVYLLIGSPAFFYRTIFFSEQKIKQDWEDFKKKFPDFKSLIFKRQQVSKHENVDVRFVKKFFLPE